MIGMDNKNFGPEFINVRKIMIILFDHGYDVNINGNVLNFKRKGHSGGIAIRNGLIDITHVLDMLDKRK